MYCPYCDSNDVELTQESEVTDDGQGYAYKDVSIWECNECGCIFEKIEYTEISYEILEKGRE